MPLSPQDRQFLQVIGRLKIYVMVLAVVVLLRLLITPTSAIDTTTTVLSISLCGVFWLTQRLLSLISRLDFELTRLLDVLKRTIPEDRRKELLH